LRIDVCPRGAAATAARCGAERLNQARFPLIAATPGIAVAAGIAAIAVGATRLFGIPGSSPLLIAIALGMLFRACFGVPATTRAGLRLVLQYALRAGVAFLGFKLTVGQIVAIGGRGALIALIVLVSTYAFTLWLGRAMTVDAKITQLIAAGTSICGASAIVGANAIAGAKDEDVSYAVASVTVLGLFSMVVYPPLSLWLHLTSTDYGIWAGASIHEVAQVAVAGFSRDPIAGQVATVVKLTRVLLLAPALLIAWESGRRRAHTTNPSGPRTSVPWFVVAFVIAAACNSLGVVPVGARDALVASVPLLLTTGLAAVGIDADARALVGRGVRPMLLAVGATVFIGLLSFALVQVSR
jgi:uncharacterized integral membrane protein (TIGR00698 family)